MIKIDPIITIILALVGLAFGLLITGAFIIWITTGFKKTGRLMGGLYVIVGKPSSGKSYVATSIAIQKMKEGRKVFTNFPVVYKDGEDIYVSRYLEKSMLLSQNMNGSVIIEDEAQKDFWSRDFKQFGKDYLMFFSSLNQHEISFYVVTQHEDRIDTVINDCANLFGSVTKVEIPLIDMPIFFNLTWWNTETDMQQSEYSDKVECFLAERVWFKREIAQAYDTKFFGTDKRPPYEGKNWIDYYKEKNIDYRGNYDFSPQTRVKNWLKSRYRDLKYSISKTFRWLGMKKTSDWMNKEMPDRLEKSVEKHEEIKKNPITGNILNKIFGGKKE